MITPLTIFWGGDPGGGGGSWLFLTVIVRPIHYFASCWVGGCGLYENFERCLLFLWVIVLRATAGMVRYTPFCIIKDSWASCHGIFSESFVSG